MKYRSATLLPQSTRPTTPELSPGAMVAYFVLVVVSLCCLFVLATTPDKLPVKAHLTPESPAAITP
jgi:threonine/homoserine/homoserine lactone efflux protein